jgi:hypothetical protein
LGLAGDEEETAGWVFLLCFPDGLLIAKIETNILIELLIAEEGIWSLGVLFFWFGRLRFLQKSGRRGWVALAVRPSRGSQWFAGVVECSPVPWDVASWRRCFGCGFAGHWTLQHLIGRSFYSGKVWPCPISSEED